jgi:hypothetical protein
MFNDDLEIRLQIAESGYGREYGWYVERDGQQLATLTEPTAADMFWVRYRVEPASQEPEIVTRLFEDDYWCSPKYMFRSRQFSQHVLEAMGPVEPDHCHATMRFLYIDASFSVWERIRFFWRLWKAQRRLECERLRDIEPEGERRRTRRCRCNDECQAPST